MEPLALVSRAATRRELALALESARGGQGRVVVLSGPAGIGKSTLVESVAAEAERLGFQAVRGRAWEFAEAPAYFPLRPALRELGIAVDDAAGTFSLWELVLARLADGAARGRPRVWIVEDLHAADRQTLDLLLLLAQPTRSLPLLILATARRLDPRVDASVAQRLDRLARDGVDLRLERLDASDVRMLAERALDRRLGPGELDAFVARSDGNPLFVVELAHAARAARRNAGDVALPETIRQLVEDRIARLSDETRRALAAGAILGREFLAGDAARVVGHLPARLVDDLRPAVQAGLLREPTPGRFVFGHILERDAIEDALGEAERCALHTAAAAALASQGDALPVLVERARHALAGISPERAASARALADRAIDALDATGAFDRAYTMARRLHDAELSLGFGESPSALLRLARRAQLAGRSAEARRACLRAADLARAARDTFTLAQAALTLGHELRPGTVDTELVSLLEEATAAPIGADRRLTCILAARLAAARQPAPDTQAVTSDARGALAEARRLGDEQALAEVLLYAGSALVDCAPIEETLALSRELRALAARRRDTEKELRATARVALDELVLGDHDAFHRDVDAMLELAAELDHPRHRWRALIFTSMRSLMHGDFAASERALVEVEQLAATVDEPALALSLLGHRVMRARELATQGELRQLAGGVAAALVGVPQKEQLGALIRGALFCRAGARDETAHELATLSGRIDYFLPDPTALALLSEAAAFAGEPPLQRAVRAALEPFAECELTTGHVALSYEGPAVRLIGLLDLALSDAAQGLARLRRALERVEATRLPSWTARLRAELGRELVSRGETASERAEGQRLLAAAAAESARLGMENLTQALAAPRLVDAPEPALALERDGEMWLVRVGERAVHMRESRGFDLLARLVAHAGEELHVLVLATDDGVAMVDQDAGPVLDDKALSAYRRRLGELRTLEAEAEAHQDVGRKAALARERDMLEREISRAVGQGKKRRAGSATERARVNVQRRLKDAVERLRDADPVVAAAVEAGLRTGTYCSYRPATKTSA